MAAILKKCSTARPLSVTSFRPRDFVLARVFVLEVMTDPQAYRFEPERVPNAGDSENEEVNYRLEGTFWVTCDRCETMPTQRECACCREQPESENKMEGIILSLYGIGRSQWKNSFLCKLL